MYKIKETIIVEGKYDKIKLQTFLDANIIAVNGYRIFKEKQLQQMLRKLADKNGLIVMTDSDGGGQQIRGFIRSLANGANIKHCYTQQVQGKEKRKPATSKDGFLGVEGLSQDIIIKALRQCNATFLSEEEPATAEQNNGQNNSKCNKHAEKIIAKQDLMSVNLYGTADAAERRKAMLKKLQLPDYLSSNDFLTVINSLYSWQNVVDIVRDL
ncbi:MAG: DUF4093 domain-containing protein [Oscillospiraceae bacterium]|jgi:ribonuclease M5|nr:DUF4093 domain-containing protein [Oscillospiraceae bacterium]